MSTRRFRAMATRAKESLSRIKVHGCKSVTLAHWQDGQMPRIKTVAAKDKPKQEKI